MDILTLALLAIWFSGRALWLTYQKRTAVIALVELTCEAIVLRETLDYARDMLDKDAYESDLGDNLVNFYEKTRQRHADEFEQDAVNQL